MVGTPQDSRIRVIASPRVCEMLRSSTTSQPGLGLPTVKLTSRSSTISTSIPRCASASRSNFSSTRILEQSRPMRTRSLTPVDLLGRREHETRRIEPDHLELRVALGAAHDLAAFNAVVDGDLRIALRTHAV